jgi:hypothetical protein
MLPTTQLEEIRAACLKGARAFKAKGKDVAPALLCFNSRPDGALGSLHIIALLGGNKDEWAELQRRMARAPDVAAAALVIECWRADLDKNEPIPPSIAERAEKKEALLVSVMTRENQYLMLADINGREISDAPLRNIDTTPAETHTGRFIRGST